MAKMWIKAQLTAEERKTVIAAWGLLDGIADRVGRTGAEMLREALRMETTGPQSVPPMMAKAMICGWFAKGMTAGYVHNLFGLRPAAQQIYILAAEAVRERTKAVVNGPEAFDMMKAADAAKDAALERMRAAA